MNVLTCVYCGQEYPAETPASGEDNEVLTNHIKICEKHPMRAAETKILKLRKALIGLVGAEGKNELEAMEIQLRILPVPDIDRMVTINAITALLETMEND